VASRGSIGGEFEFAETAASGLDLGFGDVREIGSVGLLEKRSAVGGGLENDGGVADDRGDCRASRRLRRADFSMFNRHE
jgi:hypothetical protein